MRNPRTSASLPRFLGTLAAAAACIALLGTAPANAEFGFSEPFDGYIHDQGGGPFTQAGGHPDTAFSGFQLNTYVPEGGFAPVPDGKMKDVAVELPPGVVGDTTATRKCTVAELSAGVFENDCPEESVVGEIELPKSLFGSLVGYLYNLPPEPGQAAKFGANLLGVFIQLEATVRSDDYGLTLTARNAAQSVPIIGVEAELWGVPYDHVTYSERTPFLTMPTSCTGPLQETVHVNSWEEPNNFVTSSFLTEGLTGCENVPFEPKVAAQPLSSRADSPSGLNVDINVPTDGINNPSGVSQSNVKKLEIDFPQGVAFNVGSADGLGACSPDQIGLGSKSPAQCPESSKVGTTEITTPILEEPLSGPIYLAEQDNNPFNSTLALYMVAENQERGITVKLPGDVQTNGSTGQLKATFDDNPQLPLSNLNVRLKNGPRAPLVTPSSCGTYEITTTLTPWSGTAPVTRTSSFDINQGCNTGGFNPGFSAGTTNPVAGAFAPFALKVGRNDGEQNVSALGLTLPKGVAAKIAGVPLCPEPNAAAGSCPATSQVGSVNVAAGAGSLPLWVPQAGRAPTAAYLAGPYKGDPYSLVFRAPLQAGPFDLRTAVVRAAVHIDPETAQVSVTTDPLPRMLKGIPLSYRRIDVDLNRPGFMLNPTNCQESAVASTIVAANGGAVTPASRFQVGDCGGLRFKPRLALHLSGGLGRNGHPALRAVLRTHPGEAGLAGASFTLPAGELLDTRHIRALCGRRVAAERCPRASRLGYARLWSPLLDRPLQGPIYLREPNRGLPDLLADLRADRIRILLHGRTAARGRRLRVRFRVLPDVPLSRAVFRLAGGRRGIVVNSEALCGDTHRARVALHAHSGKRRQLRPRLRLRGRC